MHAHIMYNESIKLCIRMNIRIEGKKEGVRLDFIDSTLEYLEKSLSNFIWGRKKGRKRIHFVVVEVSKGSFVFNINPVQKLKGQYAEVDITKGLSHLTSAFDLFETEDPKDLIRYFDDEYGIERVQINYNGRRIEFGLDEIRKFEQRLKKSFGTITGIITSIRLTKLDHGRIEAGIKWTINLDRSIKIIVDEERFKHTLLENFERAVRITGLIYYNKQGEPFRIERVMDIEPVKKIKPNIDKLIGIIKLEEDSVETIRKLRGEWEDG